MIPPVSEKLGVLLVSAAEYRIDGAFRFSATALPEPGDVITVEDELGGPARQARVRRVSLDEAFPIVATEASATSPEWTTIGPRERSRRRSSDAAARGAAGRRGWLTRQRRRRRASSDEFA
jgi:hypothetical protein